MSDSHFEWMRTNAHGSRSNFGVYLTDLGVSEDWKSCAKRTRIVLVAETSKTDEQAEEERDQAQEQAFQAAQKEIGTKPPTEKELGVPLYPGARYDARSSAGMSMGDQRGYVFITDDAMAKVVKFYEAKLGKKAQGAEDTGYMIALAGKGLVPDEGLAVQPNMLTGGGDPHHRDAPEGRREAGLAHAPPQRPQVLGQLVHHVLGLAIAEAVAQHVAHGPHDGLHGLGLQREVLPHALQHLLAAEPARAPAGLVALAAVQQLGELHRQLLPPCRAPPPGGCAPRWRTAPRRRHARPRAGDMPPRSESWRRKSA